MVIKQWDYVFFTFLCFIANCRCWWIFLVLLASVREFRRVFQPFCGSYVIAVVPSHILLCLSFGHQHDLQTISYSLFTIRRSLIMILCHHKVSKLEQYSKVNDFVEQKGYSVVTRSALCSLVGRYHHVPPCTRYHHVPQSPSCRQVVPFPIDSSQILVLFFLLDASSHITPFSLWR